MLSEPLTRRRFLSYCTTGAIAMPLAGCGAFKSLVNNNIPTIQDPAKLDGKQFPVPVVPPGTGRVVISGTGTFNGPFADVNPVSNQNRLTFAELQQNLRPTLQFVPVIGAPFPAQFTLTNLSLAVRLYEATDQGATPTREVVIPTLHGPTTPLVFTRENSESALYLLTGQNGEVSLGTSRISGDDAKRMFALLTSKDSSSSGSNFVSASFSVTADASDVPLTGGALLFTFGHGEAHVGI